MQFVVYERLKKKAQLKHGSDKLPKSEYLRMAGLSKLAATLLTYPHEVARTRMREQATSGVFKYRWASANCAVYTDTSS